MIYLTKVYFIQYFIIPFYIFIILFNKHLCSIYFAKHTSEHFTNISSFPPRNNLMK